MCAQGRSVVNLCLPALASRLRIAQVTNRGQVCASVSESVKTPLMRGTMYIAGEVCVCVCQRVSDQLCGTVPSLEQSPGLMFKLRPLRRLLGWRLAASLLRVQVVLCECVVLGKAELPDFEKVCPELLDFYEVLDVIFNIVSFQRSEPHEHKSWLHHFAKRFVSAIYIIWDICHL